MTVADDAAPAVILRGQNLIAFKHGPVLATAIPGRRPLVVTVLAFACVAVDPPRAAFQLAGGWRSHQLALRAGTLLFSLLPDADAQLAWRFGGVGRASGWDEVLGLAAAAARGASRVGRAAPAARHAEGAGEERRT